MTTVTAITVKFKVAGVSSPVRPCRVPEPGPGTRTWRRAGEGRTCRPPLRTSPALDCGKPSEAAGSKTKNTTSQLLLGIVHVVMFVLSAVVARLVIVRFADFPHRTDDSCSGVGLDFLVQGYGFHSSSGHKCRLVLATNIGKTSAGYALPQQKTQSCR